MGKNEFMVYLSENFDIDGATERIISNILEYAEGLPYDEQYPFLTAVLDGTIGLSDAEIRKISL